MAVPCRLNNGCSQLIGLGFGGVAALATLFVGLSAEGNVRDVLLIAGAVGGVVGYLFYYYDKKDHESYHYENCTHCFQLGVPDPNQAYLYRFMRYCLGHR